MSKKLPVGVLVSGHGSNLQALLDACARPDFPAEIKLVISNVPGAFALERARRAGVRAEVIEHRAYPTREAFDQAMGDRLEEAGVKLVVAAGFMRLLTPGFLERFRGKVLNIHPSLLPAFPGMRALEQALAYGVRFTGCTVHFVDTGCDTGPILLQAVVEVSPEDDLESLAEKVHREEHRILPEAVRLVAEGKVRVEGRRVFFQGP